MLSTGKMFFPFTFCWLGWFSLNQGGGDFSQACPKGTWLPFIPALISAFLQSQK